MSELIQKLPSEYQSAKSRLKCASFPRLTQPDCWGNFEFILSLEQPTSLSLYWSGYSPGGFLLSAFHLLASDHYVQRAPRNFGCISIHFWKNYTIQILSKFLNFWRTWKFKDQKHTGCSSLCQSKLLY